jgi:hypothetical protein
MAYVSKYRHDLFLSYSHLDESSWIAAFQGGLVRELRARLGVNPDVWQDTNEIRLGQAWPDDIQQAVRGSALFVAILSPAYQRSEYCARERKAFIEPFRSLEEIKIPLKGGRTAYRFIKIIRLPWEDDAHLEFLKESQHLEFFAVDANGIDRDLVPGSEPFRVRLEEAGCRIADILHAMRRLDEPVFVATPADDVQASAGELRNELAVRRYVVGPDAPLDEYFSDKAIRTYIEPAVLCVHLLGARYDKFAERQLSLASDLGRPLFVWISREGRETTDSQQKAFLERIRNAEREAPFTLVEDASPRTMISEVLNALKPKPSPSVGASSTRNVYIVCDPSSSDDFGFARSLQDAIQTREGFHVALPDRGQSSDLSLDALHQQRMRECDGILLYRKSAPLPWLVQQTPNVLFAEQILQRPPLLSRAFLLDDPSVLRNYPHVIPRPESFQLDDLTPFLTPLRQAGAAS